MDPQILAKYGDLLKEELHKITNKQGKINAEDIEMVIDNITNPERVEKVENIAYTLRNDGTRLDKSVGIIWHKEKDIVIGCLKGGECVGLTMNEILLCESNGWKYSRGNLLGTFSKAIESELMVDIE